MSAPTIVTSKFSPLAPDGVHAIIDDCAATSHLGNVDLAGVATRVAEVSTVAEYSEIIAAARSRALSAEFIEGNFQQIAKFLNECGLIGYQGEHAEAAAEKKGPYSIGAEGLSLITAYQRSKAKNAGAHEVVVVKNEDLETEGGSKKTTDIFIENKGVITGLAKVLRKDLDDNAAVDFNRTYIVETFGAAGGNHVVALTVRKRPDEECPVFDLFDPSPSLIRGGLVSCQNAAINGWSAQIQMNATLHAVMGGKFDREKFYHNMEPFQAAGASNCSIFSYEKAWMTALMSQEEHEALLAKHYRFDSPYGGKCEFAIDMDKVMEKGEVADPQFNLPPQYYVLSNFLTSSVHKFHMGALAGEVVHATKTDEVETGEQRLKRYTDTSTGVSLNKLPEEKAFRQKYGHLLEMVCHPHFVERFAREGAEFTPVAQSYYSASYKPDQVTEESLPYVKAINKTLPMTNQVYSSSVVVDEDGKQYCKMKVLLSEASAKKYAAFEAFSSLGIKFDEVPSAENVFGVEIGKEIDPRLSQGVCFTFQVPMQEDVLKGIGAIKRNDVFLPQKPSAKGVASPTAERGSSAAIGDVRAQ